MNYNKLNIIGRRLNFLILKRRLHDSKLPYVVNNHRNNNIVTWIGTQSPRKADINSHVSKDKRWTVNQIDNKAEYDDEYITVAIPHIKKE